MQKLIALIWLCMAMSLNAATLQGKVVSVADGDTVTLGAHTLQVRHCPGHTPGHVVFYSAEMNRAFVGDVLFAGSIGRTDFPKGNFNDLVEAITTKLWPLGNETAFVPGHGPMSTFGRERQANAFVADRMLG